MDTRLKRTCSAWMLGAAVLVSVGSTSSVLAASGANVGQKPNNPVGQPPAPFKQNDLAATSLTMGLLNQGSSSGRISRIPILTATCQNLGAKTNHSTGRRLNIWRMVGDQEVWMTGQLIPDLAPGKRFSFTYQIPLDGNNEYWLEIDEGATPDDDPENDIFVPVWEVQEKH